MHPSIEQYLESLRAARRSPLTVKAARQTLTAFARWWETSHRRSFNPVLVHAGDVSDWLVTRQQDEGAAPATINRGLSLLRGYAIWAVEVGLLLDDITATSSPVPTLPLAPKSLAPEAVDALLREAHTERDVTRRLRNEALLALLVYAGLRVQEVCDVQLRDLDIAGGTVTVRRGKGGGARRVPLHPDAQRLLRRYLDTVRCPEQSYPALGSDAERHPLFVGQEKTRAGQPWRAGITQRLVQRLLRQLGQDAAARLAAEAAREPDVVRSATLRSWAQALTEVTPHRLRHSLARRMLERGAQLPEVQRVLGHQRLSTTGIYLTPSEDDLREAIRRAGV